MYVYALTGIDVSEMAVVSGPVNLAFQSGDMVHGKRDIVAFTVFRNDFVETAELVCLHATFDSFCTIFCPHFISLVALPLFCQELFSVWLQVRKIYAFSCAEEHVSNFFIAEICWDTV